MCPSNFLLDPLCSMPLPSQSCLCTNIGGGGEGVGKVREIRMAVLVPSEAPTVGLCTLCRHNFERNSEAKASSIMLE